MARKSYLLPTEAAVQLAVRLGVWSTEGSIGLTPLPQKLWRGMSQGWLGGILTSEDTRLFNVFNKNAFILHPPKWIMFFIKLIMKHLFV